MSRPQYKSGNVDHLDPHPVFRHDGKYILSMKTVNDGNVDLAITPVAPLIQLCRERGTQVSELWAEA